MTIRWVVAKYMEDLRRREPVNVGVILYVGGRVLHRFVGERPDGVIDGRIARTWVGATTNYKRWVEYWRHQASALSGDDVRRLLDRRSDDNYYLEFGGERIVGTNVQDADLLLEQLYTTLVEPVPPSKQLDVSQLTTRVFERLEIADRVQTAFSFEMKLPNGASDRVRFDYRYDNGQTNLFQRVSLTFEDDRSWHFVHAASWAFERAQAHFKDDAQTIALIKPRMEDDELDQQLRVLEQYARVVDVSREELATTQLADLLHLSQPQLSGIGGRPGQSPPATVDEGRGRNLGQR